MNPILSIVSPLHRLSVEEVMKVAQLKTYGIICNCGISNCKQTTALATIPLLFRYESLTSRRLVKEMFVCEVENPIVSHEGYRHTDLYANDLAEYESAVKKVWFEGFEEHHSNGAIVNREFGVWLYSGLPLKCKSSFSMKLGFNTIGDFIYEIDRYNRTATTKIQISVTQSFLNEWLENEKV